MARHNDTLEPGVISPKNTDDMFIGWTAAPKVDRRFLLGMLPLGLVAGGGASAIIARAKSDPGAGVWQTGVRRHR